MQKKNKKQQKELKKKLLKKIPVKSKTTLKKDQKKLSNLEFLLKKITSHKKVKTQEVENHSKKIKTKYVISSPKKPQPLNELEKRTKEIHSRLKERKQLPMPKKEMQEIKNVAAEITKHRIVTDFDRVIDYVKQNKKATEKQIAKDLSIEIKRVKDCAKILEEENLIEIDYPIFGDISLQVKGYKKTKKVKKNKNQQKKRC